MEDANPIRILRDYSKPSHEGYKNTMGLPIGNNVDLLQKVPHHGIDLWLLIQIFYDHIDYTTQMCIDFAAGGGLKKLRLDEAWATIEKLAQYEDEGWNDAVIPDKTMSKRARSKRGVAFTPRTSSIRNSSPAKVLLKPSSSPLTKTLSPAPNGYDPSHLGVSFRLGERATLSGLRKGVTVKPNHLLLGLWPTIGDDGFNVGYMKVAAIRDPRVNLAHPREAVEEDKEDNEGDEVAGGDAGHEGAGGSTDMYRNISQGYEADYLPVGYQGYMPSGYEYCLAPLKMTLSDCSCSV
nr:hypothetical protein [Tanacetum cinerariifolium]